jgi:XTP/dITP diphosphohydrolase
MKELPKSKREASLKAILCLAWPDGKYLLSSAGIRGIIANKPAKKIQIGFPFRSILWIPIFKKYFINLNQEEWDTISHRRKAIKKFIPILKKYARH